jgi:glycosyltransferase involved in cell wall biosynthesis
LPVVITRVPPIAAVIHAAEAGIAIKHDGGELAGALLTLLTQDDLYARYRANAIQLAARYSWNRIFGDALAETLNRARSA